MSVEMEKGAQWYGSDGNALAPLSASGALVMGTLGTDLAPNQAEWIETAEAGAEYRARPSPLARLPQRPPEHRGLPPRHERPGAGHPQYFLALVGLLWSLHIMDYDTRDEIGTWLLKLFSLLAVATAIAGLGLYFLSPQRGRLT